MSTTTATPALVVKELSHSFGDKKVLDTVALSVAPGEFVVLLGLNGAGKSTLFSLITRLYDNVSGEIRILGYDVRRKPTLALQKLGVVFQSRTLDADLTLIQNLKYHAALHGFSGREADAGAMRALEIVGLADRAKEKIRSLSGGQARRVEIARSLMHRPSLLLLDEATVGLDLGSRESVVRIVRNLVASEGLGVLWATHLMDEVKPGDRVVVLHKGRVLFDGGVPELFAKTGKPSVSEAFRVVTGTAAAMEDAA
jgi:ABC-2 type transport system ATP-binding protein